MFTEAQAGKRQGVNPGAELKKKPQPRAGETLGGADQPHAKWRTPRKSVMARLKGILSRVSLAADRRGINTLPGSLTDSTPRWSEGGAITQRMLVRPVTLLPWRSARQGGGR